ncbi:MAG: M48 family metalloprotease [Candidatus Omnitrophica bacterium]|nr:M48 family metalloprotease [Candidatus Omnitrophota bacterium]
MKGRGRCNLFSFFWQVGFISLLSSLYSLLLSGCITSEYNVGTHTQDTYFYSSAREIAMGSNIHKQISKEFKLSNNPYDIERLDNIAKRIAQVVDRKELGYYFYIVEKDDEGKGQVNAFSLPGGYTYIFKDLMEKLDDDELAFVVAHEVAHIVSRHHIKRLQAAMGYNLILVASGAAKSDPGFTESVAFALAQMTMSWSREDELNADGLAVKYTKAAGFDPQAGIRAQEKLYQESKKEIRSFTYFRTHPYHAQRIRNIKETLLLPLGVDDYIN